jgi:hypothetical protein
MDNRIGRAVEPFVLLRPQDLPQAAERLGKLPNHETPNHVRAVLDEMPHIDEAGGRDVLAAAMTPPAVREIVDDPEESTGNRDNDAAFGIVRVTGDLPEILAYSALRGYHTLLDEWLVPGTTMPDDEWIALRVAFDRLLGGYCDRSHQIGHQPRREARRARPPRAPEGGALTRWTRGHHIFMVLVQGLIVAIDRFTSDRSTNDRTADERTSDRFEGRDRERHLELATALMWGCRGALRFTGDFPYDEYEKHVRPTLMPPTAPPDMSGLRWRDHEYLIKQLTGLRSTFAELPEPLWPQRGRFLRAVAGTYDVHRLVCQSFVGIEQPSVLMATHSEKPAVDTLRSFKRSRTGLLRSRGRGMPRGQTQDKTTRSVKDGQRP